jgi:hypothetical protein
VSGNDMSRFLRILLLLLFILTGISFGVADTTMAEESAGQIRVAYFELSRLQALSTSNVSYKDYRSAFERAKGQVNLLRDGSLPGVEVLRKALAYDEQALAVWRLQADSDFPVDSIRTDEAVGAAVIAECHGVSHFHNKGRDQVYVQDAVACLWRKAAEALNSMPPNLR